MPDAPLVLTRPAEQAASWLQALAGLGVPACNLPLVEVQPVLEAQAPARLALQRADAVFFTSPAAVQALWQGEPLQWPQKALALCVGPGTATALRGHGVEQVLAPPADAQQFDSETLWPLLRAHRCWQGQQVLWLRGDGGRDWLIEQLRAQGALLDLHTVYRRVAAAPTPEQLCPLLMQPALWLFSSSEALGHLASALTRLALPRPAALFTHPRIAECAKALGWSLQDEQVVAPRVADVARAYHAWLAAKRASP